MVTSYETRPADIQIEAIAEQNWRMIAASVRGPSHELNDGLREDAFTIRIVSDVAIIVVCDGAGSAQKAAEGATSCATHVVAGLVEFAAIGDKSFAGFQSSVIASVEALREQFARQGCLADYHSTLLGLLAQPERIYLVHVGDGLAGIAPRGEWEKAALSKPANGEYSNETFFVTDIDWRTNLRFSEFAGLEEGGAAIVLTDGAMPFVIAADDASLSRAFMDPVSRFFSRTPGSEAAAALAATLDSADARRISKDDKTIVWLTCGAG